MFTSDTERIIPHKRLNLVSIIQQILLFLFFLAFVGVGFFEEELPDFLDFYSNYLTIIFIVGILGFTTAFSIYSRWNQQRKWLALAEELGFQAPQPNRFTLPTLRGTHRGHQAEISQTSQRKGRSRVYFTKYQIYLNQPVGDTFEIQKRSLTHLNNYKIGDDEIDKKHSTTATSERLIGQILRARRLRLGLLQLGERARTRTLTLTKRSLIYVENGQTADTEYLKAVVGYLSDLAHTIERYEQTDYF